ncbi:hypothetical protein [Luteimonas sp. 3794]|uniref:hypothetical protein n=1 Tax=Luteimonas sp. 3794 TaxID=2817730 RepID=UPI00285F9270|nr:hypothetical protein [Luteimonas sp. 3794]MDR6993152.1 hypothetical protein [Luteimonas sp. 3794]
MTAQPARMGWPGRMRRRHVVSLLMATVLMAGCAPDSDARDGEGHGGGHRPEARTPDFLEAYEAGFQRGIAEGKAGPDANAGSGQPADRDFAERWAALSGLAVSDVAAYVQSGAADAWLEQRYRSLGFSRDLVSANALLFLANWEAYTGMEASPAQAEGVRRQIEGAAGGARSRESASELELRRRVYELMAATLTREHARVRATGGASADAFKQTVRQDFERISNNDLAKFTLTAEGFEER